MLLDVYSVYYPLYPGGAEFVFVLNLVSFELRETRSDPGHLLSCFHREVGSLGKGKKIRSNTNC